MLLPSAIPCDSASHPSNTSLPRLALTGALFSPPASPPTLSSQTTIGNIMTTCRSLQSFMATPHSTSPLDTAAPMLGQLPTPPLSHAAPPLKLRLRSRPKPNQQDELSSSALGPRKRIVKRAPPRGANKRRRADDDEMGRDDSDSEADISSDLDIGAADQQEVPSGPSTPKRARIAPEQLPLGLERSDFHDVHLLEKSNDDDAAEQTKPGTDVEVGADGEHWSTEDDRILVELVLDKLKLSKTEWEDCARSLGKDHDSVGKRWKSLMLHGDVGLKTRGAGRRARLHATWR